MAITAMPVIVVLWQRKRVLRLCTTFEQEEQQAVRFVDPCKQIVGSSAL